MGRLDGLRTWWCGYSTDTSLELWEVYKIQLNAQNDAFNNNDASKNHNGIPQDPKIADLLKAPESESRKAWEPIYEAEQRLARYIPDEMVASEAKKRFVEAKRLGVTSHEELARAFEKATAAADKRAIYISLLDDVHFRYVKRNLDRKTRRSAAKSLNTIGTALLGTLLVLILLFVLGADEKWVGRLHAVTAIYFGILGAYFSRMIAFQSNVATLDYDILEQDFANWSILVRMLIGAIGAVIFYLLLVSGLIGGNIFPGGNGKFVSTFLMGEITYHLPSIDFAKLLVWSFIAGFSERLLPDQLSRLDTAAQTKK